MPIVDVAYQPRVTEEPYDGDLRPGDVIIRFVECGPFDSADLDLLVEVRSKWFATRAEDRHQQCERLRDAVREAVGPLSIGVYLSLPVAGWAQAD